MTFTVTQAPLRISLFGGGTDRPEYYEKYGPGQVLSFGIDKYMRVVLNKVDNDLIKLMYSKIETVKNIDHLEHDIVRNIWKFWNLGVGWEIASFADIPTVGTGMGSSSSFTVALLEALSNYDQMSPFLSTHALAETAFSVETDLCKSPIGKQDHYAAAYGGMNNFVFYNGATQRERLSFNSNLESKFMLFFTGKSRSTNEILSNQKMDNNTIYTLTLMSEQAEIASRIVQAGDISEIGRMLHEAWMMKRSLPGSSNDTIDDMYSKARAAGAAGGKILGAGGGGFMLLYVEPEYQNTVREVMYPLTQTHFKIEYDGAKTMVHES
jgi:D-glycero-alpha-D-manno-heptose-7-phosphate kinase